MKEMCVDVVNTLAINSPHLRECFTVECDKSFTKDLFIKLVRMPAVESVVIDDCKHLSARDIQDILCLKGQSDNLTALLVSGQRDFKFVHLLSIVMHNHNLTKLCIDDCDPSLFGEYDNEKSLVEEILSAKNKTLKLETQYFFNELYMFL
jgi:hypothetical protein